MAEIEVIEVTIPQLGANDDMAIFEKWGVEEGQWVNEGDQLGVVETSKAAIDLVAPANGVISLRVEEGGEYPVGTLCALIGSDLDAIAAWRESTSISTSASNRPIPEATRKAIKLADELEVDLSLLVVNGTIREADVRKFAESSGTTGIINNTTLRPVGCELDPDFLGHLRKNYQQFSALDSEFKIALYRNAGALIGEGVILGRNTVLIADNIEIGDGVVIEDNSTIRAVSISIGAMSQFRQGFDCDCQCIKVGSEAFFARDVIVGRGGNREPTANLVVGDRVFVGERVLLNTGMPITIGDGCFIGQFTSVMTHNIGYSYLDGYDNVFAPIEIGRDVQVGVSCFLYPGIALGGGSVISSNSSVVSSIPDGKMAAGVPAKVLKDARRDISPMKKNRRFDELRKRLLTQLSARALHVEELEMEGHPCLKVEYQGTYWSIIFANELGSHFVINSPGVVISMNGGNWMPSDGDAYFDLKNLTFIGDVTPVSEGVREFLRKAGIKLSPWPWRYKGGML